MEAVARKNYGFETGICQRKSRFYRGAVLWDSPGCIRFSGSDCQGKCSTMIPRPFGLGIFCGGRYRTCTRSGLPFRSSWPSSSAGKRATKKAVLPKQLPGLRYGVNQRLLNWGARRAAFRPYFTKPKLDFA